MIRIRSLRKRFGDRLALDGVDAQVAPGECIAVVGPSGCGKSTLLRCLNALTPFDEGQVEIAGFALAPGAKAARTRALREAVGMVFQELHLFPHLTALQNVTLAPQIVARQAREATEARGRDLLARVGMGDRASAYPSQL